MKTYIYHSHNHNHKIINAISMYQETRAKRYCRNRANPNLQIP